MTKEISDRNKNNKTISQFEMAIIHQPALASVVQPV